MSGVSKTHSHHRKHRRRWAGRPRVQPGGSIGCSEQLTNQVGGLCLASIDAALSPPLPPATARDARSPSPVAKPQVRTRRKASSVLRPVPALPPRQRASRCASAGSRRCTRRRLDTKCEGLFGAARVPSGTSARDSAAGPPADHLPKPRGRGAVALGRRCYPVRGSRGVVVQVICKRPHKRRAADKRRGDTPDGKFAGQGLSSRHPRQLDRLRRRSAEMSIF
jgi:hypothetical protein